MKKKNLGPPIGLPGPPKGKNFDIFFSVELSKFGIMLILGP